MPQESVGILIFPSLPWWIWSCKIYPYSCFSLNIIVMCKFSSIITSYCFPFVFWEIFYTGCKAFLQSFSSRIMKYSCNKISTLSLYIRHYYFSILRFFLSYHCICFPVSESCSSLYTSWSSLNHSSIIYLVFLFSSILVLLSFSSKIFFYEFRMSIIHIAVDGVFAYCFTGKNSPPSADLFWRVIFLYMIENIFL